LGLPWASDEPLGWIESEMGNEVKVKEDNNALQVPLEHAKGIWQQFTQYVAEVKIETRRVTWPGKQEIYGTTVMVILTTFAFGIYFYICDEAFQFTVSRALRYFMHRG
jgi:preprotein translocase SecE subunit